MKGHLRTLEHERMLNIEQYIKENRHSLKALESGLRVFNGTGDTQYIVGTSDEFREWGRVRYVRAILEFHAGTRGEHDD